MIYLFYMNNHTVYNYAKQKGFLYLAGLRRLVRGFRRSNARQDDGDIDVGLIPQNDCVFGFGRQDTVLDDFFCSRVWTLPAAFLMFAGVLYGPLNNFFGMFS